MCCAAQVLHTSREHAESLQAAAQPRHRAVAPRCHSLSRRYLSRLRAASRLLRVTHGSVSFTNRRSRARSSLICSSRILFFIATSRSRSTPTMRACSSSQEAKMSLMDSRSLDRDGCCLKAKTLSRNASSRLVFKEMRQSRHRMSLFHL